jgi:hypothetical protein
MSEFISGFAANQFTSKRILLITFAALAISTSFATTASAGCSQQEQESGPKCLTGREGDNSSQPMGVYIN